MKGAALALLAGILALALLATAAPRAPETYEPPVPAAERARNAALLAALASGGIERAWVDTEGARVLVVFEPPAALAEEVAARYALGAAALVAPEAEELAARSTTGREWRVAAADVRAYQEGSLPLVDLEGRVSESAT